MVGSHAANDRLNEAIAHHAARRFARAESIYRDLANRNRDPRAFQLWGQLAEQQGRLPDALQLYGQAMAIAPNSASTAVRKACTLVALGRAGEAEATLRRVLGLAPESAEAWNTLGFVLKIQGKLRDALACHQRAVELNPKLAGAWCQLGLAAGMFGRNQQALQCFDHALGLEPDNVAARFGRAQALHKVYRVTEAVAELDRVLALQPANLDARSFRLFALQSLDLPPEQLAAEHRAYGAALRDLSGGPIAIAGGPERRLRLGILSTDLRTHSCAYFLEPLLRHLDRSQFELYLYHDHFVEDDTSARLRSMAVVWRNFVGQSTAAVEKAIRADRPDILIDLNGHVVNTVRLPLFARRVAPVQVTYLGYPDTTGVPNMDYRLTDAVADPAGAADRLATEKLVRFAPTAWTYQPPIQSPPVGEPPCASSAQVTFGCFNSPSKFSDGMLRAWATLLMELPNARLHLKGRDFDDPTVRTAILGRLQAAGLPLERVVLLPRSATTLEHLAQYGHIDVALDTSPYNGTTTTCEALWMGRPVVTLRGGRHASRVSTSLLAAVGHSEWVAGDAVEYVRIARALVADPRTLARTCAALRAEVARSVLLDHPAQSARFAAALRQCWRDRVGAQPPTTLPDDVCLAATA